MANPNRAPLHIDDAENIRKFTAQIRRVSGQLAFPSGHGKSQDGSVNGAVSTVASSPNNNNEALGENLNPNGVLEHGDRPPLHPRALQQVLDESPQLKGIQAPHPTPESHRPSPAVVADDPPQFSHEEIGQAMMQAFDSMPSGGGIEASIWAKRGPVRRPYEPKFSDIEGKRMLLNGTEGERNNKNKEEARKRSQEHNENFERMSFKIADSSSQEKALPSKDQVQPDKGSHDPVRSDEQDEEQPTIYQPSYKEALSEGFSSGIIKSLTSPSDSLPSIVLGSGQPDSTGYGSHPVKEERHRSTATQTMSEHYVLIAESKHSPSKESEYCAPSKGRAEIDWSNVTLPADSVIEAAINHRLECAKESHQKALEILRSANPKVEIAKALVDMGILIGKPEAVHAIDLESNVSATVKQTTKEVQQAETSSNPAKEASKGSSSATSLAPVRDIVPETKPTQENPQNISAQAVLAAGLKFAKSYTAAHGASKARPPSEVEATKQVATLPQDVDTQSMSDTSVIPGLTVDTSALDEDNGSPGPISGQSSATATPSSMIFTIASPATVADHGIATQKPTPTDEENLEKAVYFKAWGKPTDRGGTAAQKRKVRIYGTPSWPVSPKPSFIAKLVFGGPLEEIRCTEHGAEVTFLSGADAQKYYEATGNGILFRNDVTGKHYAEVKLAEDVTPMSSLVQQHVDNGATRCLLAIGIKEGLSVKDLEAMASGKSTQQGNPMRRVERIETGINARNHPTVTFHFCDIRNAVTFRAELIRKEDWDSVNVHYVTDPCAIATGPRVDLGGVAQTAL